MSSTQTPTKPAPKKHHHHHHSHKKQRDDQNEFALLAVPDSDDNQARYSDSASVPKSTKKPQPQTQRQILSDGEAITPAKAKPVNRHNKSVTKINTPKSVSTMMYAGPAFHHSPAPSSLPTPKFAMRKASPAIGEAKPNEEAVQDEPLENESRTVDTFGSGQSALAAMFQADREQRRRVSTPQKDSISQPDSSQSRPRTESDNYGGVDDSVEKSAALRRLLGMSNTTPASDRDYKLPTPARSLFGGTPSHSQSHTPQPYSSSTPPPSTYTQSNPASQSQRYTQSDYQNEWNNSPGPSYHSHPYPYQANGPASPTPAYRTRQAPPSSNISGESRPVPTAPQKPQATQQTRDKTMEDQLKKLLKIGPDALSIDHQELG